MKNSQPTTQRLSFTSLHIFGQRYVRFALRAQLNREATSWRQEGDKKLRMAVTKDFVVQLLNKKPMTHRCPLRKPWILHWSRRNCAQSWISSQYVQPSRFNRHKQQSRGQRRNPDTRKTITTCRHPPSLPAAVFTDRRQWQQRLIQGKLTHVAQWESVGIVQHLSPPPQTELDLSWL